GVFEDVEALGIRLHDAVLDAVVDHLDEMAGPGGPAVQITFLRGARHFLPARRARDVAAAGRQRLENRVEALHRLFRATDHHAVPTLDAPAAPRGADITVVQPLALQLARPPHVVLEVAVAAVEDDVARLHVLGQLVDGVLGRSAGRHHDPGGA